MKLIANLPPLTPKNIAILFFCMAACITWTLLAGKDLHWDLINYHYYLPFSLFNDRFTQDFFPAGPQSYFNPLGYVPLYLLDRIGLHSAITLSLLASIHSLNIFFLYKICKQYARGSECIPTILATLIGLSSLPFLLEVGNTHLDILTAAPIMGSIYILGSVTEKNALKKAMLAGFLFGCATGLKPTNAIVAAPAIVFFYMLGGSKRHGASLTYIVFGLIGALATGGYWAYKLYVVFGNPVFPLYNAYFHSPDFPAVNLAATRFKPTNVVDMLFFPFKMALVQTWTYLEGLAPDIRFAVCYPLLTMLLLAQLVPQSKLNLRAYQLTRITRNQFTIILYFFIIYYFWVKTSANGRYAIPQLLLIGPILLIAASHLLPNKVARTLLLFIFIIQAVITSNTAQTRFTPANWSKSLFDIKIPGTLTKEPNLFLSGETPSSSYLVPFLNPESAFVNVRGQYVLTLNGPGGDNLASLIKKYPGHIRSLNQLSSLENASDSSEWLNAVSSSTFSRYALKIDKQQCVIFSLNITDSRKQMYLSCLLVEAPAEYKTFMEEIAPVDKVFDKIESMCPEIFAPAQPATEHFGQAWKRRYLNSEIDLMVTNNDITLHRIHSLHITPLGRLEDWREGSIPPGSIGLCHTIRQPEASRAINSD